MLIIRLIVLLVLNSSFGSSFISADTCSTISGSTETISTNCGPLEISGDGSNVTINSGVTIENNKTTVKTPYATNAVITNNGTIKTSEGSSALRNTLPGDISDLTNNGLITATARKRLLLQLVRLSKMVQGQPHLRVVEKGLSHTAIGSFAGISRETVTRIIGELKSDQILSSNVKGELILNVEDISTELSSIIGSN